LKHEHPRCDHCRMEILVDQEVYSCDGCNTIWHIDCFKDSETHQIKFPNPKPSYTFTKKGGGKA